ncbi:MAG TPA: hypothetical protein P5038_20815, partial [Candidatus Paceibacterota bacterium]|nr:hypothetical protein [Candidatus Paceibacterota bacterium]
ADSIRGTERLGGLGEPRIELGPIGGAEGGAGAEEQTGAGEFCLGGLGVGFLAFEQIAPARSAERQNTATKSKSLLILDESGAAARRSETHRPPPTRCIQFQL